MNAGTDDHLRAAEPDAPLALRARYVFPVEGPPIPGGVVTIRAGRIESVGRRSTGPEPIDLGSAAILPGLINAHTHLEFSDLARPLGQAGMSLPDWIRLVLGWRRQRTAPGQSVLEAGLAESVASGTTRLGEIQTSVAWNAGRHPAIELHEFGELISLAENRFDAVLAQARSFLARIPSLHRPLPGISPHAPYTVHPALYQRIVELAAAHAAPVASHLAESPEELELLATGGGPLRTMLEELGVWNPAAFARPRRPLDYLHLLNRAARVLVIHGNYLAADEIDYLAQHPDRMTVVYCPRTHAYFGHRGYPLAQLLARGAAVALGTDSRASNPDLTLLAETRYVAEHHPAVAPDEVLRMATLAGAASLGVEKSAGSLRTGKHADLVVLPIPGHTPADPHDLVLTGSVAVGGVMVSGRWVAGQPQKPAC